MANATSNRTKREERAPQTGDALHLSLVAVELLAAVEGAKLRRFKMTAYTGAEIPRWWGRLILDTAGMEMGPKTPILLEHDDCDRVGFADKATKNPDGALILEGALSQVTPAGIEVAGLAAEGFPWQASVGVQGLVIEEVAPGATSQCNGRTVTGPITIFRRSRVFETSFTIAGADGATSAEVMSATGDKPPQNGDDTMDPKVLAIILALTPADLAKHAPELAEGLRAEGRTAGAEDAVKAERARLSALREEFGAERADEALEAAAAGKTVEAALADAFRASRKAPAPHKAPEVEEAKAKPGDKLRAKFGLPGVGFSGAKREAANGEGAPEGEDLSDLPVEERAERLWQAGGAKLHAEFGGSKGAHLAFLKSEERGAPRGSVRPR
jgi:hypothetical protein